MKNVLVIDADARVLHAMQTAITGYADGLDVITADNDADAIGALSTHTVDVVCVDAGMQAREGFQLLAYMLLHHPAVPVIVTTEHDPAELADRIEGLGYVDYVHKPLDEQQAIEMINMQVDARAQGYMVGMTLFGLFELLCLESATCVLDLHGHGREGMLAFVDGRLVDAVCGNMIGVEAVHQLFTWQLSDIIVHNGEYHPVRTIATPLSTLLEEVIQRNRSGGTSEMPNVEPVLEDEPSSLSSFPQAPSLGATGNASAPVDIVDVAETGATNDVQVLCARARADMARGNWARAQTSIAQALELDSLCMSAYFLSAQWHERQGEYEQAITAYRRAVFLDGSFVPGILGMATAFKALGRRPDAQRCYRNALKQLAMMPPDQEIAELDGATAAEAAIFVSHQLQ